MAPERDAPLLESTPPVKSTLVYQISVDHRAWRKGETATAGSDKEPELLTLESKTIVEIDLLQGRGVSPTDPSAGNRPQQPFPSVYNYPNLVRMNQHDQDQAG